MRRLIAFFVVAFVGCATARDGGTVQAPTIVDVTAVPKAAPPPIDTAGAIRAQPTTGKCKLSLMLHGAISKNTPTCYLDEHISSGRAGVLMYDCDGEGNAYAVFDDQRYEGRIHNNEINIQADTELDWDDGCRWGTNAIIRGPIHGKLVWTYADRVLNGTNCSGLCRASASFDVSE